MSTSLLIGLTGTGADAAAVDPVPGNGAVIKIALTPDDTGAYLVRPNGTVTGLGSATALGSPPPLNPGERVTTLMPVSGGYLLFSDRGRVFPYGAALTRGDMSSTTLNAPIVDAAMTVDGNGYWMLGGDGGVFSFGTAQFAGSTGSMRLNSPANGLVADQDGRGYRFVAGDGGVFSFDATFRGSMGSTPLNRPVVGMIAHGNGYLMVASDGGVYNFSDKAFYGSLGGDRSATAIFPVTSIASAHDGSWYALARADGAVFPFGPGTPAWMLTPPSRAGPGNAAGGASVPVGAGLVDTSHPNRSIGTGTAASCTSAAVVDAVAAGGVITFSCGPDPVIIVMTQTAKIVNNTGPDIVIDGGGKVTLSGGDQHRILYMNTCDSAQTWTTSHCQDQDHPRLVLQNLTFSHGNATGETMEGGGGGAVFVRGGRVRIVNSRFTFNNCDASGPDVGGGAVRVLSQSQNQPVYIVNSTFGGAPGLGNACSNGGALSSIGVSWVILNSVFTDNHAVGIGANPARAGTPGGGNGGALCFDGNNYTVRVAGSIITDNNAREGGGAIFFVSNNRTGSLRIEDSTLQRNPSERFETAGFRGIFFLGSGTPVVVNSTLT